PRLRPAAVEHAERLPLAAGDRAGRHDVDARGQAEGASQLLADPTRVDASLDLDGQLVEVLRALDDELVVRRELRDRKKRALDLAREDVDAADDQHVVGSSEDARHPRERAAAGTGLAGDRRQVAGAVAQQW